MLEQFWKPYFDAWATQTNKLLEEIVQSKTFLRQTSNVLWNLLKFKSAFDRLRSFLLEQTGLALLKEQGLILYHLLKLRADLEDFRDEFRTSLRDFQQTFQSGPMPSHISSRLDDILAAFAALPSPSILASPPFAPPPAAPSETSAPSETAAPSEIDALEKKVEQLFSLLRTLSSPKDSGERSEDLTGSAIPPASAPKKASPSEARSKRKTL